MSAEVGGARLAAAGLGAGALLAAFRALDVDRSGRSELRNLRAQHRRGGVLARRRDGAASRIYVNGNPEASLDTGVTIASYTSALYVGGDGRRCQQDFVGDVDESAVYDYALGPDRVLSHYRAGSGN